MDGIGGMEDFSFPSFPAVPGQDGGQDGQDFADFAQFGVGGENVHIAGGVPFEIPPLPVSPDQENVHFAGGVPFDIPPLPFDDVESLNALPQPTSGDAMSMLPDLVTTSGLTGVEPRSEVSVAPVDNSLLTKQTLTGNGGILSLKETTLSGSNEASQSWNADFGMAFPGPETNSSNHGNGTEGKEVSGTKKAGDHNEFGGISDVTGVGAGVTSDARDFMGSSGFTGAQSGGDDFGEFGGFSGNQATATTEGIGSFPPLATTAGFGAFSENPTTVGGPRNSAVDSETKGGDDFGEFGGFASNPEAVKMTGSGEVPNSKGEDDFGEFGGFSSNPVTESGKKPMDEFGEFGGFSSNKVAPAVESNASGTPNTRGNDFGDFSTNMGLPKDGETKGGAETGNKEDDFGEFGGFTANFSSANPVTGTTGGSSGGFTANFSANPITGTTGGTSLEAKADDDFGEFGGFSSVTEKAGDDLGFSSVTVESGDAFGGFSGFSSGGAAKDSSREDDSSFANFSSAPESSQALDVTAPPTAIARVTAEVSKHLWYTTLSCYLVSATIPNTCSVTIHFVLTSAEYTKTLVFGDCTITNQKIR